MRTPSLTCIACLALVSLRAQVPTTVVYGDMQLLAQNQSTEADAFPWISEDGLRAYYTKDVGAINNIIMVSRATVADPFGAPQDVFENFPQDQSSATLSADELTIWFSSGAGIMRAERASTASLFTAPTSLTLNWSGSDPRSPSVTPDGEQMVIYSLGELHLFQRVGPTEYTFTGLLDTGLGYNGSGRMSTDGLKLYFSGVLTTNAIPLRMSRAALTDAFTSLQYLAGDIFDDAGFSWIQIHASADERQLVGTRGFDDTWANNDVFYASGINTTGIEQHWLPVPRFFPNPARTTVSISATPMPERVRITDAQGRCVRDERIYNRPCTIDVADLPNGIYSMVLIGAVRTVERLVVQH